MRLKLIQISSKLIKKRNFAIKSFGNSMHPLIQDGDIIHVFRKSPLSIKVDDVVTYRKRHKLVTHRVIYKSPHKKRPFLITKGDNNATVDRKVLPENVLGEVIQVERNGNRFHIESLYLFQSTVYLKEISDFVNYSNNRHVDFIFLKGLPLHLHYSNTYTRRIFADIDVLIDSAKYNLIDEFFRKRKYKKYNSYIHPWQGFFKSTPAEISFYKVVNGVKVIFDIHLQPVFLLVQIKSLNFLYSQKLLTQFTNELLNTKKNIIISNLKLPILDHNYLIIYQALHLFHDNYKGYNNYFFLDRLIRNKQTDFQKITAISKKMKIISFIYPVFKTLKKRYKTPIPYQFIQELEQYSNPFIQITIPNDIFSLQKRVSAGVIRFRNIFLLSPEPLLKRVLIFFRPDILFFSIYSLWLFTRQKIKVSFYKADQ